MILRYKFSVFILMTRLPRSDESELAMTQNIINQKLKTDFSYLKTIN